MQHGEGALHIAAGYGRLEIVKELLVFGAHLDMPDKVSKIIIICFFIEDAFIY